MKQETKSYKKKKVKKDKAKTRSPSEGEMRTQERSTFIGKVVGSRR